MIIASERSCSKLLNKNKCQFCKDFFFGTCNLSRGYYSWPFQYWRNYKNVYTTIPYRTSNILGNDKLSRKLPHPSKRCWKKDTVFNLQKAQLDAIEKLKTLITSASVLKHFDPHLQTRLKIDASSGGLRATL